MSQNHLRVSRVHRSKEEARDAYNRMSRWYDLLSGGFEGRFRDLGIRMLAPVEGDVVLEIGFGTGHAIVELARNIGKSGKVYGIDISEGMLGITQVRVDRAGLSERVVLECGDAAHLPFDSGFFDKIFVSFTLELFDTPEIPVVLSECLRTLREGGRMCVVAMSKKGKPNAMTRLYEWFHEKLPQYVDCRPIFVEAAVEKAGFHILDGSEVSYFGLRCELVLAEKTSKVS